MKKDGGAAFPFGDNGLLEGAKGMSLRDYFAAQFVRLYVISDIPVEKMAIEAYRFADAMLAERDK